MPVLSLLDFARWVLTPLGAGAAVWATVALFDKVAPAGIPSGVKFMAAFILAFLWPLAGYGVIDLLTGAPFSLEGLFEAVAVGYFVSQTIHKTNNALPGAPVVAVPLNITSAGAGGAIISTLSGKLTGTPVVDSAPRKIADEDVAGRDLTATHVYEDSNVTRPPAPLE